MSTLNEAQDNLEKKIRKNIYGKPQTVLALFPAGLGAVALNEVNSILKTLWFAQKFVSETVLQQNVIRINPIHLFAATELLMRSQCLSDIRLIIFEGKVFGKEAFIKTCKTINWNFYINKEMTIKIRVDSVASKAFHEAGLKALLSEILHEYGNVILTGDEPQSTTCIYADLYKNRLTLSISLAGSPLYKRGYRGVLSASAPLREDAAACCIKKAFQFAERFTPNFLPQTVLIPFSGTGTFAFEYLQIYYKFSPILFGRDYALTKMPIFRRNNFQYLLKKAQENCTFNSNKDSLSFICIDKSEAANLALQDNIANFRHAVNANNLSFSNELFFTSTANFLAKDIAQLIPSTCKALGNVFLPLNPPYGIRLNKNHDAMAFYKHIALKINEVSKLLKDNNHLLGFILCPNEETWLAFCKNLVSSNVETYHFTQGGMDIRVCQFYTYNDLITPNKLIL